MDNRLLAGYFSIKMYILLINTRNNFADVIIEKFNQHIHTFLDGFIFVWKLFEDWLDKDIHGEWKSGENRDIFSTPYRSAHTPKFRRFQMHT